MKRPPEFPVIMCHGLFGTERYGAGPIHAGDYYRGILKAVRSAGVEVYAPRVHPLAGVYRRTWKLAERIRSKYGDTPVHLVGHSMGGLDARLLASDPAWARRIVSITSIGTPHLGTPLADLAASRLRFLYHGMEKFGVDVDGLHQVSRRVTARLTDDWQDPPRAACWSIAGSPESGRMFFGLKPTWSWLMHQVGPSDGLVPVESANGWGEPLETWPHDHFRQINWMTAPWSQPGVIRSYVELISRIAEVEEDRRPKTVVQPHMAFA